MRVLLIKSKSPYFARLHTGLLLLIVEYFDGVILVGEHANIASDF